MERRTRLLSTQSLSLLTLCHRGIAMHTDEQGHIILNGDEKKLVIWPVGASR